MASILSIAFPFRQGLVSFPDPATDEDAIRASVIQIVMTGKGERVMRPEFGCDVFSFVFENNDDVFQRRVEREIRSSLARWEPRIAVSSIETESGDDVTEPGQLIITIYYTIVASGVRDQVTVAG